MPNSTSRLVTDCVAWKQGTDKLLISESYISWDLSSASDVVDVISVFPFLFRISTFDHFNYCRTIYCILALRKKSKVAYVTLFVMRSAKSSWKYLKCTMTLAQPQSATQTIKVFYQMKHIPASSLYLLLHKADIVWSLDPATPCRLAAGPEVIPSQFLNKINDFISTRTLVLKKKRRLQAVR